MKKLLPELILLFIAILALLLSGFFGKTNAEWRWENQAEYKSVIISDLQESATEIGIDEWKQRIMLGWFLTENGALTHTAKGDGGNSSGLCQCNKKYRKCAKTYSTQKKQCLQWFADYTKNSTEKSIFADVRDGHNPKAGKSYTLKIAENAILLKNL